MGDHHDCLVEFFASHFQQTDHIVTGFGVPILMTTIMFTTLFTLAQSMSRNMVEMTFRQTGYDGQASFKNITLEQFSLIADPPDVPGQWPLSAAVRRRDCWVGCPASSPGQAGRQSP